MRCLGNNEYSVTCQNGKTFNYTAENNKTALEIAWKIAKENTI